VQKALNEVRDTIVSRSHCSSR